MHNLYTLRGAQIRDALGWSKYLLEAVDMFLERAEIVLAGHHWPCWGRERCKTFLKNQANLYKFLHDQTLRLANHGFQAQEIAEEIEHLAQEIAEEIEHLVPAALKLPWHNRGYYGSYSHNAKAIYQKYLGWFDGHPANLNPHPPVQAGKRYVKAMGGMTSVLDKARASFAEGDYRWVAEMLKHAVFAEPDNEQAKSLLADTLEQLGYQCENATWRNFYLSGALELRLTESERTRAPTGASFLKDAKLTPQEIIQMLAIRLNPLKAKGKKLQLLFIFPDCQPRLSLFVTLDVCVLNAAQASEKDPTPDATLIMPRTQFMYTLVGGWNILEQTIKAGHAQVSGDQACLKYLFESLDSFDAKFPIVFPKSRPSLTSKL
eukprot:g59651.t1